MSRLAIVAPHFPEYALRYALSMAPHCDVLVCVDTVQLSQECSSWNITIPSNVVVETIAFKTIGELLFLYKILRNFKPNVVHFQEAAGPRRALFNAALARLMRSSAAIILTVHDPAAHAGRDALVAKRTQQIAAYLRKRSDKIVVHGQFCADQMTALFPSSSTRLIISEHGLILEPNVLLRPPVLTPLRLYFFGRMEAYKGVEVLLSAAQTLHEEGCPFALSIAGRGPELNRLESKFMQLPEVSVFNGFVPPSKVMTDIQSSECVVLPYLSATQSGVLAAAYAGRRYVLASSTGGLPDVVVHQENGLLVPPGDPEALAEAIRLLIKDEALRAHLLSGARATAEQQLDWNRIGNVLAASFSTIVESFR